MRKGFIRAMLLATVLIIGGYHLMMIGLHLMAGV